MVIGGKELMGQTAVVTGAGSGIGEAIARLFAQRGARVIAADISGEAVEQVVEKIRQEGGDAVPVAVDVSQADQVRKMIQTALDAGGLDVMVNNAGVGYAGTVLECTEEQWQRMMDVNAKGTFLGCKYAVEAMLPRGGGVIVNIASMGGIIGVRNRFGYCASKGAVVALTKAIAIDYVQQGIRANCIAPGTVDSPWVQKILSTHPDPVAGRKAMEARQPMGRMGTPEEIAHAALYLASPASSFVTGTCLIVDGGIMAGI